MTDRARTLRMETLEARAVMDAALAIEVSYFSTAAAGSVTGSDGVRVQFDDSDVIRLDLTRGSTGAIIGYRYQLIFDGSDVGLETDDEDIDSLAMLPDGSLIISTLGRATVPGLIAEDEDLLLFTPAENGYGSRTRGTWSMFFDGSDVGLTLDSEDVDAVAIMPDGRLLLSTLGNVSVPGVNGAGEDLLAFTPAANGLGANTAGTWAMFFDGSTRALNTFLEPLDAADIQGGFLQLSTSAAFNVGPASGADEDIFQFDTATNTYVPGLKLDGSTIGLAAHNLDAIELLEPGDFAPEAAPPAAPMIDVVGILSAAASKLAAHDARSLSKTSYPNDAGGAATAWSTTGASNWVSGFYPGMLWQMYEATGDVAWITKARAWQAGIEGQKTNTGTHDLGFMLLDSFGQGARLTGSTTDQAVVNAAASSLSARYNASYGAIQSWSGNRVIIDSMMNIELLFQAAQHGGTTSRGGTSQDLYNMAVSHATKALQNHVRPDGSTYHVVTYSTATGAPISKSTAQGMSASSTWSRGQAWAVYGFTMTFRETHDPKFLDGARKTADWFISHLPEDFVPPADFSSPYTDLAHKDSSAAAVAASGLFELSTLEFDPVRKQRYFDSATRILDSLASPDYFSAGSDHAGLLLHGARKYPGDNVSLIFGDYYFLEATIRYSKIRAAQTTMGPLPLT